MDALSKLGEGGSDANRTPCPVCKGPVAADGPWYPFCTKRCRTIDLGRWLKGDYKITRPIEQADLEEG